MDARTFPSGLNAAAIVDRGGGNKGQYLADKCRNESASTLTIIVRDVSHQNWTFFEEIEENPACFSSRQFIERSCSSTMRGVRALHLSLHF